MSDKATALKTDMYDRIVETVLRDFGVDGSTMRQTSLRHKPLTLVRSVIAHAMKDEGASTAAIAIKVGYKGVSSVKRSTDCLEDGTYDSDINRKFSDLSSGEEYSKRVRERAGRLNSLSAKEPDAMLNPLVMNQIVCVSTQISRADLLGRSKEHPYGFARKILIWIYIKHAGFTHEGAAQCLMRSSHSNSSEAISAIESGKLDKHAKHYLPGCDGAEDYARIMYERAINTPLPKHRRAAS